jgi:hypothetical protein
MPKRRWNVVSVVVVFVLILAAMALWPREQAVAPQSAAVPLLSE